MAFSTSLLENSNESTRSGTSDDGAVVGTAELAVPSVISLLGQVRPPTKNSAAKESEYRRKTGSKFEPEY